LGGKQEAGIDREEKTCGQEGAKRKNLAHGAGQKVGTLDGVIEPAEPGKEKTARSRQVVNEGKWDLVLRLLPAR
jgi:hypothetical protein